MVQFANMEHANMYFMYGMEMLQMHIKRMSALVSKVEETQQACVCNCTLQSEGNSSFHATNTH
jgi:hypothetical protein